MPKKKEQKITCTFEFSEGATQRITDAFVDLYYAIKDGIHNGPPLLEPEKAKEKEPA